MVAVPALLDSLHARVMKAIAAQALLRRLLVQSALTVGIAHVRARRVITGSDVVTAMLFYQASTNRERNHTRDMTRGGRRGTVASRAESFVIFSSVVDRIMSRVVTDRHRAAAMESSRDRARCFVTR